MSRRAPYVEGLEAEVTALLSQVEALKGERDRLLGEVTRERVASDLAIGATAIQRDRYRAERDAYAAVLEGRAQVAAARVLARQIANPPVVQVGPAGFVIHEAPGVLVGSGTKREGLDRFERGDHVGAAGKVGAE